MKQHCAFDNLKSVASVRKTTHMGRRDAAGPVYRLDQALTGHRFLRLPRLLSKAREPFSTGL